MKTSLIVLALLAMLLGYFMAAKEAESYVSRLPYVSRGTQDIRLYAAEKVLDKWGGGQYTYFSKIVEAESNWNYLAANPRSSARGLCQALTKLHDLPEDYLTNPYSQIDWCIQYIKTKFGSPEKAWKFWQKNHYF